jgi:aryl-alcohol dehydrogenase-like predicted oxidoreductase
MSLPANQHKLEIVTQLTKLADDAGLTLIELAIAFVLEHPAITSAIIGPRTMEHLESQFSTPDVQLESSLLDAIDALVPPGTNVNREDGGWIPSALTDSRLRRRHH